MKDKEKQSSYFANIGSSSLLVIFLILCLVTFAVLSLSSAKSDYTFSQRLAQHKQTYYEASSNAEDMVDKIDDILFETAANVDLFGSSVSDSFDNYLSAVRTALDGSQIGDTPVGCEQSGDELLVSFQVPAGDSQALLVTLRVNDCRKQATYYDIKTWKIVNTGKWENEQPLNLISIQE